MVIVYERPDSMKAATVKAAAMFNNRFDHFAMKVKRPRGRRLFCKERNNNIFLTCVG